MIRILFMLILNYINFVNNFNVNKCCGENCYHNGMFIKEHCCSIAEYTVLETDTVQLTCQACNDSDYNRYIHWRFQSQNSIKVEHQFHSSTVTFRGSDIPNDRTGRITCYTTVGGTDKTVHFEYFVCSKLKKPDLQCVIGPENYSNQRHAWRLTCELKIDTSEYKNANRCHYNFNINDIIVKDQGAHQVTQSCFSNCTWVDILFRKRSWFDGGTSIMQISAISDVEKTKYFNLTIPEYQKIYVQNDKPTFNNCTSTACSFAIRTTLPNHLSQYSSFDYNITIFDEKSTEQKRFYKANNSELIIDTLKPFKNYTIQMTYKLSAAINERQYHSNLFTFSNCTTLPSVPLSVVKLTNGSFIVNDPEVVVIWKPINSDDYGAPGFQYAILVENVEFNTRDLFYKFDFAKYCKMQNECSISIGARNVVGSGMFQSLQLSFNLPAPKNVMAINPPDEDRFRLEWTPVESSAYYVAFWCNVSSRKSWEMCNESLTWETIHGNQTWLENVGISKMNIFGVSACGDDHKCSGIRTAREFSSSFSDFVPSLKEQMPEQIGNGSYRISWSKSGDSVPNFFIERYQVFMTSHASNGVYFNTTDTTTIIDCNKMIFTNDVVNVTVLPISEILWNGVNRSFKGSRSNFSVNCRAVQSSQDQIPTWVISLGIVVGISTLFIIAVVWTFLNRVCRKVKKSREELIQLSKLIDESNAHRAGVQDWVNNSQRDANMKKYLKKLIGQSLGNLTFATDEYFNKPNIQRSKSWNTVDSDLVPPEVPNSPIPKFDADDSEPTSLSINPYEQDLAADDLHGDILHRETIENLDLLPNEGDEKIYSPTHLKLPEMDIFVKDKLYSDSKVANYAEQPYVYYQEAHFDRGK